MGRINKRKSGYAPTDDNRNRLGWTDDLEEAKIMAKHGYVNEIEEAGEICLWPAWNEAVASGHKPLEDQDGRQFINLRKVIMSAKWTKYGWDVDLMPLRDFLNIRQMENSSVIMLKFAEKPYRLE